MKFEVRLFFLQYPGFGPMLEPPLHTATVVGHLMHSPGEVIFSKEYEVPLGHEIHLYWIKQIKLTLPCLKISLQSRIL
jgi:hypothetical protein